LTSRWEVSVCLNVMIAREKLSHPMVFLIPTFCLNVFFQNFETGLRIFLLKRKTMFFCVFSFRGHCKWCYLDVLRQNQKTPPKNRFKPMVFSCQPWYVLCNLTILTYNELDHSLPACLRAGIN
jgi:hypothetical protein